MKKASKFSLRVLFNFCLIFCQYQPGVAYKSVAYKKSVYSPDGLQAFKAWNLIKKGLHHRYFPVNIAQLLRTAFS